MGKVILVDASGSMGEDGKKSVIRYVLNAIDGIMRTNWSEIEYKVLYWNETIFEDNPKMDCSGCANASALSDFLVSNVENDILFIGDGNYTERVKKILSEKNENKVFLMLGIDCNRARLKKIFRTEKIYETADVVTCIDDFINI